MRERPKFAAWSPHFNDKNGWLLTRPTIPQIANVLRKLGHKMTAEQLQKMTQLQLDSALISLTAPEIGIALNLTCSRLRTTIEEMRGLLNECRLATPYQTREWKEVSRSGHRTVDGDPYTEKRSGRMRDRGLLD